jgi:hypothetical protein
LVAKQFKLKVAIRTTIFIDGHFTLFLSQKLLGIRQGL